MLITLCIVRKRTGAGKRLIALPYVLALFFKFIQQAINFVSYTLNACEINTGADDYYKWNIASTIFHGLHTILFLFAVIWTLNTMLRKQLGHNPSALRMGLVAILIVLGSLNIAYIVMYCYISWMSIGYRYPRNFNFIAVLYIDIAFSSVYLASTLASAALSLLAVRSLKTKRVAGNSLMLWVSVLYLSMFVYSLISLLQTAVAFSPLARFSYAGYAALYWISSFFRALAFASIIGIARDVAWRPNAFATADAPVEHDHDAYSYQQDPIYDGTGQRA
ncbi:hypothetical protein EKO04_006794 [Ascochyta lentis]|uniref:Uncharacterized protein n=1 Tax=Ascochyta lentis TaxID=205686 RepID=A0A8H7MG16_9PLEO|nr:hypothetical protein EKO04_006794 [Ascochyta lentis]